MKSFYFEILEDILSLCCHTLMGHLLTHTSFEKSPRHDAYVPKFEAELAQFCEKLVSFIYIYIYINTIKIFVCILCFALF